MRKDKLQMLSGKIQETVDKHKYNNQKPIYYWGWVRRLIGVNMEIIKIKYHGR